MTLAKLKLQYQEYSFLIMNTCSYSAQEYPNVYFGRNESFIIWTCDNGDEGNQFLFQETDGRILSNTFRFYFDGMFYLA